MDFTPNALVFAFAAGGIRLDVRFHRSVPHLMVHA